MNSYFFGLHLGVNMASLQKGSSFDLIPEKYADALNAYADIEGNWQMH